MSTDDMAKLAIRQNPGLKIIELNSNNYFLSGRPAVRLIEMNLEPPVKMMFFATILGQNAYFVGYVSAPEKFPDYLQTVQPMIDSFQLISKPG